MVMLGRSVNLTILFLGGHRPLKRLTSTSCTYPSPVTNGGRRNESMWPDRVSNPGPLVLESDALPTALRGAALIPRQKYFES